MRLQHRGGEALYRDSLQAATTPTVLSGFRKIEDFAVRNVDLRCTISNTLSAAYGLHMEFPPQLVVVPAPPSARTAVGVTRVQRKSTAEPRTSSTRFTVFSLGQRIGP